MVCRQCGYQNEAGAEFCGSCGTFLEWAGELAEDGTPLAAQEPAKPGATGGAAGMDAQGGDAASASPTPPSAPTPVQRASAEVVGPPCPVCGKPVPKGRTFCPHCGADTRAPQAGARAAVVSPLPSPRRLPGIGLGPILVIGSLVVVVALGVVVLPRLLGGGPDSTATAGPVTVAPSAVAEASATPLPSESASEETAEPTPTPLGAEPPRGDEARAAIVAFLEEFDAAYRGGNSDFLLEHLDPAVIAAYSASACRDSIESFARPDFATTVDQVSGPTAWTYTPGTGQSTIIAAAYVVSGERTRAGRTSPLSMHLSYQAGSFYWFANAC